MSQLPIIRGFWCVQVCYVGDPERVPLTQFRRSFEDARSLVERELRVIDDGTHFAEFRIIYVSGALMTPFAQDIFGDLETEG